MSKKTRKKYYSLQSFFSYMGRYKLRFAIIVLSFAWSDLLLAIIPVFIGKLVGALVAHPVQGHQAIIYVWVLILCGVFHDVFWRLSELLYMHFINPLGYNYENILFKQLIRKPYPYFVDKFTGKLSSNINTISVELRGFFENLTYNYVSEVVSLITISIILTAINWQTGLLFIAAILAMLFVGRHTIRGSAKYEKISTDIQSTKNGKITDAIANFVNIKSFQKEHVETWSIEKEQRKTVDAARKSYIWSMVFWGSMSVFVRDIIWPATISLNVYLYLHHEISIAQLTTILSSILVFSSYIWEIIWYVSQFNLKLARIEEAHTYLFGNVNIVTQYLEDIEHNKEKREFHFSLQLQDLDFAYPDKSDVSVLNDVNLTLAKGEKIGIVGKSGSGKSTLTKLLLGYYPLDGSKVLLDGVTIETIDLAQLISYVPQDTSLFHRTIADNIAYATDKAVTRQEVITAAKQAHANEFIVQLSDGYNAMVGERGVKLSAGQRQRIAIARALLDNKPILILDEATSALDSESEVLVQQALEALWEHKTVIAIAHRLSTLRHMDRILVMDKGKVVEQGTHQQLLKAGGTYAKLWDHQSGGFIDE